MNQVFTKKKLAAALTLAFATGGAAVLAVAPVPGVVAVAQANEFADTTLAVAQSTGVAVPASATASLTGQQITLTENIAGALSAGQIILTPSAGKFVSATTVASSSGVALTLQPNSVDSNGNLIIPISASGSGAPSTITVSGITMNTSSVATGTAITGTVSTSSTVTGLTKGVSATLGTVTAPGVTAASSKTSATKVGGGQTLTVDGVKLAEAIQSTFTQNATVGVDVVLTLPSGYTWLLAPTMSLVSGTDVVTGGVLDGSKGTGNGTGKASAGYGFNATSSTAPATVEIKNGTVFIPVGTAAADFNVTVTTYRSNAVLNTTTLKLGQIVTSGTTGSFVEASGSTATVDYNTLFAGRNYAGGLSTGVGGEADQAKLTEAIYGSLAAGGTVTLGLSTGKFGAAPTAVDVGYTIGAGVLSTDSKTATYTVGTASTSGGGAGNSVYTFGSLDMRTATAGDLNVTMGGTAGTTAATVKIAEVKDATTAAVTGALSTVTGNTVITVPTMTITEGAQSALAAGNVIGIDVGAGNTIQKSGADAADGAALTNGTDITVKVTDTTGADVTTAALGATPTITVGNGITGTVRQVFIAVSGASSTAAGKYTVTISGLKVKTSASASAGDISAVVAGADSAGTSAAAAMGTEDSATWTSLASAKKQTVVIGKIVAATVADITATATGANTSQTITGNVVAAGNDQGKTGMIYAAADVPTVGVFLKNSAGTWVTYNATAPVAVAGPVTLGTTSVEVTKDLNVSGIVGTTVFLGYGVGTTTFGALVPWQNMLDNGTYKLVYTIK